jgi:hypothetical protein
VNNPNKTKNTVDKLTSSEERRGIKADQLLFSAVTLGAAIIGLAIGGPKLPPYQGD